MLEYIENHLPDLKKLITKNVFQNETAMKAILSKGYGILPFPVRLVIKEETFVNFCIEHKHALFGEKPKSKSVSKTKAKLPTKKAINPAPKRSKKK